MLHDMGITGWGKRAGAFSPCPQAGYLWVAGPWKRLLGQALHYWDRTTGTTLLGAQCHSKKKKNTCAMYALDETFIFGIERFFRTHFISRKVDYHEMTKKAGHDYLSLSWTTVCSIVGVWFSEKTLSTDYDLNIAVNAPRNGRFFFSVDEKRNILTSAGVAFSSSNSIYSSLQPNLS